MNVRYFHEIPDFIFLDSQTSLAPIPMLIIFWGGGLFSFVSWQHLLAYFRNIVLSQITGGKQRILLFLFHLL